MQPGMPTLVREWLPSRLALGTVGYSSGMTMGAMFPAVFTIAFILPAVGGSRRLDVVLQAIPALLIAPVFLLGSSKIPEDVDNKQVAGGRRWWPDWKNDPPRLPRLSRSLATLLRRASVRSRAPDDVILSDRLSVRGPTVPINPRGIEAARGFRTDRYLDLLPRLGQQAPRDQQRKQRNRRDGHESSCQAKVPGDQPEERSA